MSNIARGREHVLEVRRDLLDLGEPSVIRRPHPDLARAARKREVHLTANGFFRRGKLSGSAASDGCPDGAAYGTVLDLWLGRRAAFQL